jgi:catechol 2,3-dioxygenase-like lactoylglutathione lyase family enzyme
VSTVRMTGAVPILRQFDEDAAFAFYRGYLGFAVDWTHQFEADLPLYAQVSRGELALHLSWHHGDATPGSAVFLPITGIDALHAELSAKSYRNARPAIEDAPWGARTLTLTDPSGNRLLFNEAR